MLKVLFIILIVFLSCAVILTLMLQSVHKGMTVDTTKHWNYGNYDLFLKEFNKRKWKRQRAFPKSFFECDPTAMYSRSEIHAGIIKFNDMGMVLRGISYIRYEWFLYKNSIKHSKRSKLLWN